jgi:hypothetical protein
VAPNIKITPKQIRFLLDWRRAWGVQPLHVPGGIPADLQGYYAVPLDEERKHGWGDLSAATELRVLRQWVARGYKLPEV